MDFDGTEFRGVDDEAIDADSPVDTVLLHYLKNGVEYIERDFDRCGLALRCRIPDFTATTLDPLARTLTSVQESSFHVVPLFFERAPESVRVDILSVQEAFFAQSLGWSMEIGARLECEDDVFEASIIVDHDDEEYTLTVDTSTLDRGQSAILHLTCRAITVSSTDETFDGVGTPHVTTISTYLDNNTFIEGDATADQPDTVGGLWPPVTSVGRTLSMETGADHILALSDTDLSIVGQWASTLRTANQTEGVETYLMPWSYMASVNVSVSYQRDRFDGAELRQNIVEKSSVSRRIATAQTRQHERPKLVSVGTSGTYRDTGEGWPKAHRSAWTYADSDRGQSELLRESIAYIDDIDSVDIHLLMVGASITRPEYNAGTTSWGSLESRIASDRTQLDWTLTVSVEQLQNGSALIQTINTADIVRPLDHYPAPRSIHTPILQQSYYQEFFEGSSDYRFTYREGQLMSKDVGLIQPVTMTIRVPDEIDAVPFDVVVEAEADGFSPEWTPADGFGSTRSEEDVGRIYRVGHSIYARRSP